jgi:hypothetical protein
MNEICPKSAKCPLFRNNLLDMKESEEIYKALYCNSELNYKNCKRYMVSEKSGKCSDFVMPNSSMTVDEIIIKMNCSNLFE